MPDGQFLGHAHAAVQLHGLLADEPRRAADGDLRRRHRPRSRYRIGLEVEHRQVHRGHGLFEFHVHIHHPVLQHLETADRSAELLALLAVVDGVGQDLAHAPDRFGAHRGGALVARPGQRLPAVGGDQCLPGKPDAVENDIRGAPVVDGAVTVHLQAGWGSGGVELGCEQRDHVADSGRDQQVGGDRRRHDDGFGTGENPAPAVADRCGRRRFPVLRALAGGQCDDGRSVGDPLQHRRRGLPIGAGQQPPGHHHGVDEGFDHQRPAQFLGDHHDLDRPAAAAAGRFRQ